MNVLLLTLGIYSHTGGIERFGRHLLRSLAELSGSAICKAEAIVLWDSQRDAAFAPIAVRFQPCNRNKRRFLTHVFRSLFRFAPDAIFLGHVLLVPLVPLIRLLRPRARIFLFAYGFEVWDHSPRLPAQPPPVLHRWLACHFVDRIVSISRFTANRVERVLSVPPSRISLLPCAIDLPNGHRPSNGNRFSLPGAHRLLTVSRLSLDNHYKGHSRVIHALPSILNLFPGTHYFLVGDGPLRDELHSLASCIGVAPHVHFLGPLDDSALEHVYSQCHAFVMPSRGEGFGIVFLEAWKHRLPIIAGNRDASPEVIDDGANGLLVNPDCPDEIAAAACRLFAAPAWAASLGEAGHRKLCANFGHDRFRERLVELLA